MLLGYGTSSGRLWNEPRPFPRLPRSGTLGLGLKVKLGHVTKFWCHLYKQLFMYCTCLYMQLNEGDLTVCAVEGMALGGASSITELLLDNDHKLMKRGEEDNRE